MDAGKGDGLCIWHAGSERTTAVVLRGLSRAKPLEKHGHPDRASESLQICPVDRHRHDPRSSPASLGLSVGSVALGCLPAEPAVSTPHEDVVLDVMSECRQRYLFCLSTRSFLPDRGPRQTPRTATAYGQHEQKIRVLESQQAYDRGMLSSRWS